MSSSLGSAGKGAWLTKFAIETLNLRVSRINSLMQKQKQHCHCLSNIYVWIKIDDYRKITLSTTNHLCLKPKLMNGPPKIEITFKRTKIVLFSPFKEIVHTYLSCDVQFWCLIWNSDIEWTLTRNHHELRQRVLVVKRAAQMKINFCFTTYI